VTVSDAEAAGKTTVVIADDHALFAEGLTQILGPSIEVVGVALDGRAFVEQVLENKPHIGLVDVGMPQLNGIEATRELHEAGSRTRIIFVTQKTEREYVRAAIQAGAYAYVLKQSAASELLQAIRDVKRGDHYLSPAISRIAGLDVNSFAANSAGLPRAGLTPRQREVLQLIAQGKSAKAIAHALNISIKTVEFHKAALMNVLGSRTTAELTRYAVEHGLVDVPDGSGR
jgi:DNA-binding NarL/FixJ family response regulator